MCGRFALGIEAGSLLKFINLVRLPDQKPRFNIAPSQKVLIARETDEGIEALMIKWGLHTFNKPLINARSETVLEKPTFKNLFKNQRCVFFATGFYEWEKRGKNRIPHYFFSENNEILAFGGIWSNKGPEPTAAILTKQAESPVSNIHDRMPVILQLDEISCWIARDLVPKDFSSSIRLNDRIVSSIVNKVQNDTSDCIRATESLF